MTRCLVVCIDGTWNSKAENARFFSYPTNVQRISDLLLNDGTTQRVVYVPGIGTRGFADRLIGGVWGTGSCGSTWNRRRRICGRAGRQRETHDLGLRLQQGQRAEMTGDSRAMGARGDVARMDASTRNREQLSRSNGGP